MTPEQAIKIIDYITTGMVIAIITIYSIAAYWDIKFIIKTKWKPYSSDLIIYTATTSVLICIVFLYLLISYLLGKPVEISFFGSLIIRPSLFLLGAGHAANARARHFLIKNGGATIWELRT